MNADEFRDTSIAFLRSAVGWQSAIARRLDVAPRTVRRWLADDHIPDSAECKLAALIGAADLETPWPRDEWMLGDALGEDGRRREYIAHLQPPRFVARLVNCDDYGDPLDTERPADILSGVVYSSDDTLLCEIAWIDEPDPGEILKWLEAATDEIDRADGEDAAR